MIRDERMRLLVNADKEPIQPFISRVRDLASCGVSTVLVVGGCGEYFDVADQVILMDNFTAVDATDKAKEISTRFASAAAGAGVGAAGGLVPFPPLRCRRVIKLLPRDASRTHVRQATLIEIGEERIDLTCVEQIADISQTRALADILLYFDTYICSRSGQEIPSVVELLDKFEADVKSRGLDVLSPDRLYGHYALPRRYEIAAAMNRLRSSVFSVDTDAHVFSFASGGSGSVGNSKKAKH
jgi:predicted ABC-class ATPase